MPLKYKRSIPTIIMHISFRDCERILKSLSKSELELFLYAKENKSLISKALQLLEAKKDPLFFRIKSYWQTGNFSAGDGFFKDFTDLESAHIFLSDWTLNKSSDSLCRAFDFVIDQSLKGAPVMHSLLIRTGLIYFQDYKKFTDYQDYILTDGNDLLKELLDEGEFRSFDLIHNKKSFDIVYMLTILKYGLNKANNIMFSKVARYCPKSIDVENYFKDPYDLPGQKKLEWIFSNKVVPRQDNWFALLYERDEVFLLELDKIGSFLNLIGRPKLKKENKWLNEFCLKLLLAKFHDAQEKFWGKFLGKKNIKK